MILFVLVSYNPYGTKMSLLKYRKHLKKVLYFYYLKIEHDIQQRMTMEYDWNSNSLYIKNELRLYWYHFKQHIK